MLSTAATNVLSLMQRAEDTAEYSDAEIVCEGRYCYVGLKSISKATVNELLRLVLIRDDSDQNGKVERYTLNEEGRAILIDSTYIPKITAFI